MAWGLGLTPGPGGPCPHWSSTSAGLTSMPCCAGRLQLPTRTQIHARMATQTRGPEPALAWMSTQEQDQHRARHADREPTPPGQPPTQGTGDCSPAPAPAQAGLGQLGLTHLSRGAPGAPGSQDGHYAGPKSLGDSTAGLPLPTDPTGTEAAGGQRLAPTQRALSQHIRPLSSLIIPLGCDSATSTPHPLASSTPPPPQRLQGPGSLGTPALGRHTLTSVPVPGGPPEQERPLTGPYVARVDRALWRPCLNLLPMLKPGRGPRASRAPFFCVPAP